MKNILIFCCMMLFTTVSCQSGQDTKSDDAETAEALYVVQSEINRLSADSTGVISYLIYADADRQNRMNCEADTMAASGILSHVFYKHKYHFVFCKTGAAPAVFLQRLDGGNMYEQQTVYLSNLLREINRCFAELQQEGGGEMNFVCDDFVFYSELKDQKAKLKIRFYSPKGKEIIGAYTEESRLLRDLSVYEKEIFALRDSVAFYERQTTAGKTFLRNAELCAEYQKRRWEHSRQVKLIFSVYDRRTYEKIKKIIDDDPKIMADKDLYTPENLKKAQSSVNFAEKKTAVFLKKLERADTAADSLRKRLIVLE